MIKEVQTELFDLPGSKYPNVPGYKRLGTSKLAAEEVKHQASYLRNACLVCVQFQPSTADEIAETLDRSILAIRPRISELVRMGKIIESGQRRKNRSGKLAAVWRAL